MSEASELAISPRLQRVSELVAASGEARYRYRQVRDAIFRSEAERYSDVSVLPAKLREDLGRALGERVLSVTPGEASESEQTTKVLFELADGKRVESVEMRYRDGHVTICVSTQVGCPVKCVFCATGSIGYTRNLSADEIVDQVLHFTKRGTRVTNVVFMGMGEPLLNPATFDALEQLTHPDLLGLSPRRLSVSTVGILPALRRLTKEHPSVNLAFSLHSPFEDQRTKLIPYGKGYPLAEALAAVDEHALRTRRKVFLVYLLMRGVNDTPGHAEALVRLVKARPNQALFHVNLTRYNAIEAPSAIDPAANVRLVPTSRDEVTAFKALLEARGLTVTVRQSFGDDIDAACGQLYAKYPNKRGLPLVRG